MKKLISIILCLTMILGLAAVVSADENTTVSVKIEDYAVNNNWVNSTLYDTITMDSYVSVTSSGTPTGNYGLNTGKYYSSDSSDDTWRIYQNENPSVTISATNATIVSVKITYGIKNSGVLTLNGNNVSSDEIVSVNAASVTFSVGNTGDKTNGQAQITAIEVVYTATGDAPAHTHDTSKTGYDENGHWTICSCGDESTKSEVVAHTLVNHICECGYIGTPTTVADIIACLYALPSGAKLEGVELTGKVTEITEAYSEKYQNITLTIVVDGYEDYPIVCYRMKSGDADASTIEVGNYITVVGTLTNYNGTREYNTGAKVNAISTSAPETQPTEPETQPTEPSVSPDPSNPKDGDMISVIVALMAVSACGIAIIGKKKF